MSRRFNTKRDGVMSSVRAEFGIDADPESNIVGQEGAGRGFVGHAITELVVGFRKSARICSGPERRQR